MADAPQTANTDAAAEPVTSDDRQARQREKTRERVARHRAATKDASSSTVGQRPGRQPGPPKGNPFSFSPAAGLGDRLSTEETKRNLVHAHLAAARILRSSTNMDELDDEFEAAASSYADIANHLLPWLRILPRLIAPLVLVGALIAIWSAILVRTPWLVRWWERRKAEQRAREEEERQAAAAASAATVSAQPAPGPTSPAVVFPVPNGAVTIGAPAQADAGEHPPVPVVARGYRDLRG